MPTITKTPVTWNLERLICECGGEMMRFGPTLMSYPPQYVMWCGKCGAQETRYESYPRVMWEEVRGETAELPASDPPLARPDKP